MTGVAYDLNALGGVQSGVQVVYGLCTDITPSICPVLTTVRRDP